nr:hypothetical protein [Candidatus Freyarchaeota archaeon]
MRRRKRYESDSVVKEAARVAREATEAVKETATKAAREVTNAGKETVVKTAEAVKEAAAETAKGIVESTSQAATKVAEETAEAGAETAKETAGAAREIGSTAKETAEAAGRREYERKESKTGDMEAERKSEREESVDYSDRLERETRRGAAEENLRSLPESEDSQVEKNLGEKWDEDYCNRLAWQARREVLGDDQKEKPVSESEGLSEEKRLGEKWDEDYCNRLAREARREVLGESGDGNPVPERKGLEEEERFGETKKDENYYDRLARETRREVLGESEDKKTSPESNGSEEDEKFREQGFHGEEYYDRLARETHWEVLGRDRDEPHLPERVVSERGDRSPVRTEAGEVFKNLETNNDSLFEVRRCISSDDFQKAELETRKQVLEQYDRFLEDREKILRELRPDTFSKPDFSDQCLSDTARLTETRKFLENAKDSNLPEREPEKYSEALHRYDELLNKRYDTLARIEPRPRPPEWIMQRKDSKPEPEKRLRSARMYTPERTAGMRENSKPEATFHVVSEGWVQGDEKSLVKRAVVRGEKSDVRFEHSVEHIKSKSPLGETEGIVKRSEARVEKDVVWDEDSVRRIYLEISRIKGAYRTRTDRPYAGLLELAENVDKREVLTVVDRGEREWLRNVDYVTVTKKWRVDEKGVTHMEQCTQVIGHRDRKKGETDVLQAAVTDKAEWGVEKDHKINVETIFRFNPKATAEKSEEKEKRGEESKPLITSSRSETSGGGERQQISLNFHQNEGSEKSENVYAEQVIYTVIHVLPEENATNVVETADGTNESTGAAEKLEGPAAGGETVDEVNETERVVEKREENITNANSPVENAKPIDVTEESTSPSQQVLKGNFTPEHSTEKAENKKQSDERVEGSSEGSQETVSDNESLRWEDAFILVEGRGRKWILPILRVLDPLVEGVRKNGGDEERYCSELRKRGAPGWLSGWMLRRMVYERRVPEDIFRIALEYSGRNASKELDHGDSSKLKDYIEPVEEKVPPEAPPKDVDSASETELETRFEFLILPNGKIVSTSKEDDFWEIVDVIKKLLDFKYSIEPAESEDYIVALPDGKRYKVSSVGCFLVLEDGRRIAVMLPEPAIVIQETFPNIKEMLKKVVEPLLKSQEGTSRYIKAFTTESDLLNVLTWWVNWHLKGLSEVTEEDIEEAVQSFESRLEKIVEMFSEESMYLSRENVQTIRGAAIDKYPEGYRKALSKILGIDYEVFKNLMGYLNRTGQINKGILLKIYDILNLNYPQDILVDRKELLVALLTAKGERGRQKPERPWWEQPPDTYFIPNEEDFEKAYNEAIKLYETKLGTLKKIKETGIEYISNLWVVRALNNRFCEVEKTRKFLEIIGWEPEKVRELSLVELKDNDPINVPKEGKGCKLEIINRIKGKRKEENSREKIPEYAARKLTEELQKKNPKIQIEPGLVHAWLYSTDKRIPKKMYLLMCSVFDVEPNKSLHSRKSIVYRHNERKRSNKVNFRRPVKFKFKNGEIIEIIENEGEFYVMTKNGMLPAEKYIHEVGEKGWGLTIIDYETEDGIYTVIKEMGELWLPDTQPWYIISKNPQLQVNPELLRYTVEILQDSLEIEKEIKNEKGKKIADKNKLQKISGITGTGVDILEDWTRGYKSTTLKRLIEFIALESALTGEDIKKIIKRVELRIKKISRREVAENTRKNMLYINLRTIFGVALLGHTVADGSLSEPVEGETEFEYFNTERYYNIERVNKLLEYFGHQGNVYSRKRVDKEEIWLYERLLIAPAIRRAVPEAVGKKTLANPRICERITDDEQKAIVFLQSITIDEAAVDHIKKTIRVVFSVDVVEEIGEEFVILLKELVKKRLEEIEPEKLLLEKVLEIFKEEKIEYVNNKEIRIILESAMKRIDREGIQTNKVTLEKIYKYLSERTKITEDTLKHYLHFIETHARHIEKGKVSSELVQRAESKINNIFQAVKKAFENLDMNPRDRGIRGFYVSKTGRITADMEIYLSGDDVDKAYMLGIIKGYKKQNYLVSVKQGSIKIFDKKRGVGKLSKNQIEILESKKVNCVTFSEIEDHKDIVDVIQNNKPKELEDKYKILMDKGIKVNLDPKYIHMGKRFVSVEWWLVSWPEGEEENGQDAEDS